MFHVKRMKEKKRKNKNISHGIYKKNQSSLYGNKDKNLEVLITLETDL